MCSTFPRLYYQARVPYCCSSGTTSEAGKTIHLLCSLSPEQLSSITSLLLQDVCCHLTEPWVCFHCVPVDPTPNLARALGWPFLGLSVVCLDVSDVKGKQAVLWGDEETGVVSNWYCKVIWFWCQHFISQTHPCGHQSEEWGFLSEEGRGLSREAEILEEQGTTALSRSRLMSTSHFCASGWGFGVHVLLVAETAQWQPAVGVVQPSSGGSYL